MYVRLSKPNPQAFCTNDVKIQNLTKRLSDGGGLERILISPPSIAASDMMSPLFSDPRRRRIAIDSPRLLAQPTARRRIPPLRCEALPHGLRGLQLRVVGIAGIGFGLRGVVEGLPVLGAGGCGRAGGGDLAAVGGGDVLRALLLLVMGVRLGGVLLGIDGGVLRVGHAFAVVVDVFGSDVADAAGTCGGGGTGRAEVLGVGNGCLSWRVEEIAHPWRWCSRWWSHLSQSASFVGGPAWCASLRRVVAMAHTP